jgi:hypothetical protein
VMLASDFTRKRIVCAYSARADSALVQSITRDVLDLWRPWHAEQGTYLENDGV